MPPPLPPLPPTQGIQRPGAGVYLKRAFFYRWNVLLFLGAAAAALLSPLPDVALPLVAAAELVYLTGLISHPKFRDAVDAQHHQVESVAHLFGVRPKVANGLADRNRCAFRDRNQRREQWHQQTDYQLNGKHIG